MAGLPPRVREEEFRAVDTTNEGEIAAYFEGEGFIDRLHSYLNETSCLRDIQTVRRRWVNSGPDAFGSRSFKVQPRHWYTRSAGGRAEAQFNVGLFPEYLRIGLGFEFTNKNTFRGGSSTLIVEADDILGVVEG